MAVTGCCGLERGACSDYGCALMEQFIGADAETRARFEALRAGRAS